MKYLILVADGMADNPLDELDGRTPLEAASTPNLDAIARKGAGGYLRTIPSGMGPGSDIANLSILGYDPRTCYTGRGPLEAAAMGVELGSGEMAFRCNLITEREGVIEDYSAGHISSSEAAELMEALNKRFDLGRFYSGVSYRNIFVTTVLSGIESTPPHDVMGGRIEEHLIRGSGPMVRRLNEMILESRKVLEAHPVNLERRRRGLRPANMIWLWGEGVPPELESFERKHGLRGGVISAVDLVKGIAIYAGMTVLDVPGATGLVDTNWEGKAEQAISGLETLDLIYIHVEAIDEASHAGDVELKVRAIEEMDRRLLGRLLDRLSFECRLAVLPDHYTPLSLRTHTAQPVPFVISPAKAGKRLRCYSEAEIKAKGRLGLKEGQELMRLLTSSSL